MTKNERFFFFLGGGINCRQRIENKSFHDDVQELIRDESGPDYLSFFFFFFSGRWHKLCRQRIEKKSTHDSRLSTIKICLSRQRERDNALRLNSTTP